MRCLPAALALAALAAAATAEARDRAEVSFGDTRMAAGGDVVIDEPMPGNAYVAGGRVEVLERIGGHAWLSGGDVQVSAEVGRDLHASGGTVRVGRDARVGGDATLAGGSIELAGQVAGDLDAYGDRVEVTGIVDGDVELAGRVLRIGRDARIRGQVRYRSDRPIVVEEGAQVGRGVQRAPRHRAWLERAGRGLAVVGGLAAALGMLVAGAVFVLVLPRFSREAAAAVGSQPLQSLGLGVALLVGVPMACVVLTITLVGLPLALMLLFGFLAMLFVGFLVGALFLGDAALARLAVGTRDSLGWRLLFLLLALVAIALVAQVPVLGPLVWWLLLVAGTGALAMRAWRALRGDGPAPAATR